MMVFCDKMERFYKFATLCKLKKQKNTIYVCNCRNSRAAI